MQCARSSFRSISKASAIRFAAPHPSTPLSSLLSHSVDHENRPPSTPLLSAANSAFSATPFASSPLMLSPRRRFNTSSAALVSPEVLLAPALAAFTPQQAALGGLLLAVATTGKLLLNGRVLGIAGSMKGLVQNDLQPWRLEFLGGMAAGSLLIPFLMGPSAFDVMPASCTLLRMAISGLLVGYGASMANGCTSGHCISGNARLSTRSLAFTVLFMAAGVVSATATGTLGALGVAPNAEAAVLSFAPATAAEVQMMLSVTGIAAVSLALVGALSSRIQGKAPLFEGLGEFLAGAAFSVGMGFCGMSHPTKLAGFLSPFYGGWDPSLMFVMGTAILGSAIAHQSLLGRLPPLPGALMTKPVILQKYQLPNLAAAKIDSKLVIGGILFGLGVGGSGLCPGPDIVNLVANYSDQVAVHLGAMLFGLFLEGQVSKRMAAAK